MKTQGRVDAKDTELNELKNILCPCEENPK
jgi:hypothetical protein